VRTVAPPGWASSTDLVRLAGITYRQVDHWTSVGWLRPPDPSPGSGAQRHYPPAEVVVAYVMGALVRAGVAAEPAALAARTAQVEHTGWVAVLDGGVNVAGRLPARLAP